MSYKILIVDDEPANLRMLERLFRNDYKVVTASSGIEALEFLLEHDIAVIISDQRMPAMTGIEFLKRAAEMRPNTVRIILTGYTDVNALVEVLNSGIVYKYVTKPWVNVDLQQTVKKALEHHETVKAQHQLRLQNERLEARFKTTLENFVQMVARLLDLKEPNIYGHVCRTRDYATAIGQQLDLAPEDLEQISMAALLHEFAHAHIPNEILFKTTEMTVEEYRILIDNFERELQILAGIPALEEVASVIRSLHERFDGNGYPDRFGGEQIPLHARIVTIADAYDQLTFPRHSQSRLTPDDAILRLELSAGKQFDPALVNILRHLKSTGQVHEIQAEAELILV